MFAMILERLIENYSNSILIVILVGSMNILVPFIFKKYYRMFNLSVLIISIIYLLNVLYLDHFYLHNGQAEFKYHLFGKLKLYFNLEAIGLILLTLMAVLWPVTIIYTIGYLKINQDFDKHTFFALMACSIRKDLSLYEV